MSTFALIPGAWHGAWCFERLVPELETLGHSAVAIELPGEDVEAGAVRYAEIAAGQLGESTADLIIVGHSLGGLTAPLLAARLPARAVVYLAALIPDPGRSAADQFATGETITLNDDGSTVRDEDGRSSWVAAEIAQRYLYSDMSPAAAEAAFARLRPQAATPSNEICPLGSLEVAPSRYVICADDRMMFGERSRRVAAERLGVEPIELPGGHCPMLSRPGELARLLVEIAA